MDHSMPDPRKFTKALIICFIICTLICGCGAAFGYLMLGKILYLRSH
ncbi:hypothetical protein DsansV1_C21g0168451 [Dioscorea sansibarensis]